MLERFSEVDINIIKGRVPDIDERILSLGNVQGHVYVKKQIAAVALTHRSLLVYWSSDTKNKVASNECLEFLGDSYLNYFISWETARLFPHLQEGELSRLRAAFVGTDNISRLSRNLGLKDLVLVAGPDVLASEKAEKNILADLFESVTAGLLMDAGEAKTKQWLFSVFEADFKETLRILAEFDLKTQIQEWTQSIVGCPPVYKVVEVVQSGKDQQFVVAGFMGDVELARAQGPNKREASKAVAKTLDSMRQSGQLTPEKLKSYLRR